MTKKHILKMKIEDFSVTPNNDCQNQQLQETISQILPIVVKNILLVAFGMMLGFPTILIPTLSNPNEQFYINQEQISWIGSINMISLPLGCLLSGIVSQAIGRKITMQVSSILLIFCWLTFKFCNDVWQIYVALFISGLTGGLLESPVLTYVAEITEPRLRGALLSTGPLSVTLGIFLEFLLGSAFHWRNAGLYSALLPILAFVSLFFVPESPYWLIMMNKMQKARESLSWVRGWSTVDKIDQEFQEMVVNSRTKHFFKLDDYKKLQFIHPFILICYLFVFYNFSGLATIPVYAIKIFESLEVPINHYNATIILGLAQFLGCLVCVFVLPHTGKRVLAFISIPLAALGVILVATFAHLVNIKYLYTTNNVSESALLDYKWIPLVFILLTAFALNCGVRTLCWGLVAEGFPMETRAVATGTLGAISYCLGFGSNKSFLTMVATLTLSGVFWLYGIISLISLVIVYLWLPETEGKTLQSITNHFAGKNKLDNKVGLSKQITLGDKTLA